MAGVDDCAGRLVDRGQLATHRVRADRWVRVVAAQQLSVGCFSCGCLLAAFHGLWLLAISGIVARYFLGALWVAVFGRELSIEADSITTLLHCF